MRKRPSSGGLAGGSPFQTRRAEGVSISCAATGTQAILNPIPIVKEFSRDRNPR